MQKPRFSHERAEYWSFVAQIVSGIAVVVSLLFVGLQIRDSNRVAQRAEANATQEQWAAIRQSIYGDRNTAEVFVNGMAGNTLDAVDRLRFLYILRIQGWATFQLWDRVRQGINGESYWTEGAGPSYLRILCTPGGSIAWREIKAEYPHAFVADLDRLAPAFALRNHVRCA